MYCENCGTKIPDGSKFCPECGAPVHHEEESLISRARRGDNAAIQQLMDQYRGMVRYQARMYVKNEDDVNEIEQQVYIKAFSKTSDLADEKRFGGWLKTIAINTAKDYVTTAYKKRSVMFTDLDDTNNDMVYDATDERIDHRPEVQMDETSRREIITKVLDHLPETQRMIIVMHYYDNLSFKDIATQLNIPMSTVTGRAQMAKNSIKESVTAIQDRDGIKLYHLSPLAFFLWLLGLEKAAPVEPPVIGKTVRIDPQKVAAKDKPHYGNPENNISKTVKAEKAVKETAKVTAKEAAQTTAKTAVKATAGKAAGAGFLATKAGKAVVAGAIAVAAAGGGTAAVHYHNTKAAEVQVSEKQSNSDEKKITSDMVSQSVKKGSKSKSKSNIVWVKEPGSLDIDDFEDLQSCKYNNELYNDYSVLNENTGYSSTWINRYGSGYDGNAIIVLKDRKSGLNTYDGNAIVKPNQVVIQADPSSAKYGEYTDKKEIYFPEKSLDYDFEEVVPFKGDGGRKLLKKFVSGNMVYQLNKDGTNAYYPWKIDEYISSNRELIPVIDGYQSGDVDLKSVSGFKMFSDEDYMDLPTGMTPTYYPGVLKQDNPDNLINLYSYNTCFVNGVIKLQDKSGKIHLWNADKEKYVIDSAFDDATFFEDGYIGVKKNKKWAFMNKNGKLVTDYMFDKVSGIYEGKTYVNYKGEVGIINLKESLQKTGVARIDKDKSDMSMFENHYFSTVNDPTGGVAQGSEEGIFFTIDSKGKLEGSWHISYHHDDLTLSGKFTDLNKIDDRTYQMKLTDFKITPAEDWGVWTDDESTNAAIDALKNNAVYTIRLPGTKMKDLDEETKKWIRYKFEDGVGNEYFDFVTDNATINSYILLNNKNKVPITEQDLGYR